MQRLVSPSLLQLAALGVGDGDHYLPAGHHLRWFPNVRLGFPRRGFVVDRRPTADWPWGKRKDVLKADLYGAEARGPRLWHPGARPQRPPVALPGGLTIRAADGPVRVEPVGDVGQGIPLERRRITLRFQEGADSPAGKPACHVALSILGGSPYATIRARARASAGVAVDGRPPVVSDVAASFGSLDVWHTRDDLRVFVLRGSIVDEVDLETTDDLALLDVWWIPVETYTAPSDAWARVGRYLLPVDGDGSDYPRQPDADALARRRLHDAAPLAAAPWDEPAWPPPAAPRDAVERHLERRHLADLDALQDTLRYVLQQEIAEARPQGEVPFPDAGRLTFSGNGGEASTTLPAVPLILANAVERPFAQLLGLAATDRPEASQAVFDYVVRAVYPKIWGMASILGGAAFPSNMPREMIVPPLGEDSIPSSQWFIEIVSLAVSVRQEDPEDMRRPADARVRLTDPAGRAGDMPDAVLEYRLRAPDAGAAAHPVGATVRREDQQGDISIARVARGTGLPILHASGAGAVRRLDRTLRSQGPVTYRISALDIWGRWSDFATTQVDVRSVRAPPPPKAVTAELVGEPDASGRFRPVQVAFDWPQSSRRLAPDLARFEVTIAPGRGDAAAVEGHSSSTTLNVEWPMLTVQGAGSARESEEARDRITVEFAAPPALPAQEHRRTVSAVVRAADRWNMSPPSRPAVATHVDPAVPAVPSGPAGWRWTTWPDADGRCWHRVDWPVMEPGSRVQVLKAHQVRLLKVAGRNAAASGEMDAARQIEDLRRFAVENRQAFVPALDRPVPADGATVAERSVDVPFKAGVDGFTVLLAMPTGPTGSRAAWPDEPDAFAIVRARRLSPPSRPRLRVRSEGGTAYLTVTFSGPTSEIRLWRTSDTATRDVREMRPLAPLAVPAGGGGIETTDDISTVDGPWIGYVAMAHGANGLRSRETPVIWTRPIR